MTAGPDAAPGPDDLLFVYLDQLRGGWRLVLGGAAAGLALGVALAFLLPSRYQAVASFVPEQSQAGRLPSGLGALAGQFGISLGSDGANSPRFYAALLQSDAVLRRIAAGQTRTQQSDTDSVRVLESLRVRGGDAADSLNEGVRELRKRIAVDADQKSNIVTIVAEARDPQVAAGLANAMLAEVQRFNLENRQTQAGRRRTFLAAQAEEAQQALTAAEERLTGFYAQNRSYTQSPELRAREAQLQRTVALRTEILGTLQRNLAAARLDEVNDVPTVSVIDAAVPPTRRAFPKRSLFAAIGLGLGTAVGMALVLLGTWVGGAPTARAPSGDVGAEG